MAIVHEIYPESAAAKDGRLQPGDQILEINSENLSKTTHAKAQTLLRQAPPKVTRNTPKEPLTVSEGIKKKGWFGTRTPTTRKTTPRGDTKRRKHLTSVYFARTGEIAGVSGRKHYQR